MVWLVPSSSIANDFNYNADRADKAEWAGDMWDDGQCLLLCVCKSHSSIGILPRQKRPRKRVDNQTTPVRWHWILQILQPADYVKYALRGQDTHSDKLNRDERREGRGGKVSAHLVLIFENLLAFPSFRLPIHAKLISGMCASIGSLLSTSQLEANWKMLKFKAQILIQPERATTRCAKMQRKYP